MQAAVAKYRLQVGQAHLHTADKRWHTLLSDAAAVDDLDGCLPLLSSLSPCDEPCGLVHRPKRAAPEQRVEVEVLDCDAPIQQ